MPAIETDRLILRRLTEADAGFVLELLNDAAFIQNIGDRGVRTVEDARAYIRAGPAASYAAHGFGLYAVERKEAPGPIGICGLLIRGGLDAPDLGFAFLAPHRARGYATEAARAVLAEARGPLGLDRILAITAPGNAASENVLRKLAFRFERTVALAQGAPEVCLFSSDAGQAPLA